MIWKNVIRGLIAISFLTILSPRAFSYETRINCGGEAYTASNGDIYMADQEYTPQNGAGYTGGASSFTGATIDGTEDDQLYQSDRWGDFSYAFDLPDGFYRVELQFAETYFSKAGKKVFDIFMENTLKLDDFDIYSEVGWFHAIDREFTIQVNDGRLNLTFSSTADFPKLNAISVVSTETEVKPQSTGPVQVSGRHILVNGERFFIKGVGYQPVPIGYWVGEYDIFSDPDIYNRDFALLREMHCNTIRTWAKVTSTDFLDAAYNEGIDPIYVIMGFHIDNSLDLANPAVKENIIEEFKQYVNSYKNHPAVLMWAIGNEQNYWYGGDIRNWYILVNELARAAYEVEGAAYHPVTTPNGDIWNGTGPIGSTEFKTDDASMAYLDVWGANIYSGWSFQGRLQHYANLSSKPFWISEYGFPGTDQRNQAEGAYVLWNEMATNSDICSGGTIMEYSDEWWKSGFPDRHDCSEGAEFWGIMSTEDNETQPDVMHKKLAYFTLQEKWATDERKNLAFGKGCYVSSVEDVIEYKAANAVDGNFQTRWSSEFSDPQWIYVDLEGFYNIGQIVLNWEAAYAAEYKIQVLNSAFRWKTIYSSSEENGHTDFIYIDEPVYARYVRLYATRRGTQWGYSLYEFEVYEPIPENIAKNKAVFASSVEGEGYTADNAIDGDYSTRWSSQFSDPQWIYVDLGALYDINQIILRWEAAYGASYKIQRSGNGRYWTDVYDTVVGDGTDDYVTFDFPFKARYIRLYCLQRGTQWAYSLWELEVIGRKSMFQPGERRCFYRRPIRYRLYRLLEGL